MLTKDEYVAEMKKRLDEWNAEIEVWEAKGNELKEDARVKYQEQLVVLRAKREEGAKKLEEMQAAAESSWEHLRVEAERVWEAMKDSANTFRSHFK